MEQCPTTPRTQIKLSLTLGSRVICLMFNVAFKEMILVCHFLHRIMTISKKLSVIKKVNFLPT